MSDAFFTGKDIESSSKEVFRFALVAACYNNELVQGLIDHTSHTLKASGAHTLEVFRVPGAQEIPFVAHRLASTGRYAAVIALGVLIAGATQHHEVLALSTAQALQAHAAATGIPMINGILCVQSFKQGQERALGPKNRGREFALSALQMAQLVPQLRHAPGTPV